MKVLDERTGESRQAAFQGGQAVDYEAALRTEEQLRWERFGSLDPQLHKLASQKPDEVFAVLLKMNVPEERFDKSALTSAPELEAAAPEAARLSAEVERRANEAYGAVLASVGESRGKEAAVGPFVQARLSGRALRELAHDPRVAFAGLHGGKEVPDYPTIAQSLPTTRTDFVQSAGIKGAGVKLAILESGGLTTPAACFNIGATQDGAAAANSHMTKSAGIIGNRYAAGLCNGSWQGYAPEATVLLANGGGYTAPYAWAKTQGVNVITMSWHYGEEETSGSLHARDVFFDYAASHYPYPTIFTSAGNQADAAYASGKGYNFFGVGNVNNDGDGNRCNDTIASSSSWKDPISTHSDREVPALASPGDRHDLLGSSFGGTSAATPVTASIATLLMSTNPSLKFWPEGMRAILLATANYQSADGANYSTGLDGRDGTGMTNSQYGYWVANRRETTTAAQFRAHDYGYMSTASFTGGFLNKTWTAYTGSTTSRIRVALTWNSKTAGTADAPTSSVLDGDLDIWVYDPDNLLVAFASSWDSNHEFVEFTPAKVGNYTIKVRGFSVPADFSNYYGVAWTTHYDICP